MLLDNLVSPLNEGVCVLLDVLVHPLVDILQDPRSALNGTSAVSNPQAWGLCVTSGCN